MAVADPGRSPNEMTIEQLAAQSGMTVRNIRSHQARGLLPPPEVRMRLGYYGPEHLARLRLIRDLQADGFNLAGIKRLLEDTNGTVDRLQRFKRALTEPHEEPSETMTLSELGRRFRVAPELAATVMSAAQRLGILVPAGGDTFEAPNPSLLALAEECVARGISLNAALAVFEEVEVHCDAVARAFVQLLIVEVWGPFERARRPAEGWPEILGAIDGLRPLASSTLQAIFDRRMRAQIEAVFGEITEGLIGSEAHG